jgi:hypothetical protein
VVCFWHLTLSSLASENRYIAGPGGHLFTLVPTYLVLFMMEPYQVHHINSNGVDDYDDDGNDNEHNVEAPSTWDAMFGSAQHGSSHEPVSPTQEASAAAVIAKASWNTTKLHQRLGDDDQYHETTNCGSSDPQSVLSRSVASISSSAIPVDESVNLVDRIGSLKSSDGQSVDVVRAAANDAGAWVKAWTKTQKEAEEIKKQRAMQLDPSMVTKRNTARNTTRVLQWSSSGSTATTDNASGSRTTGTWQSNDDSTNQNANSNRTVSFSRTDTVRIVPPRSDLFQPATDTNGAASFVIGRVPQAGLESNSTVTSTRPGVNRRHSSSSTKNKSAPPVRSAHGRRAKSARQPKRTKTRKDESKNPTTPVVDVDAASISLQGNAVSAVANKSSRPASARPAQAGPVQPLSRRSSSKPSLNGTRPQSSRTKQTMSSSHSAQNLAVTGRTMNNNKKKGSSSRTGPKRRSSAKGRVHSGLQMRSQQRTSMHSTPDSLISMGIEAQGISSTDSDKRQHSSAPPQPQPRRKHQSQRTTPLQSPPQPITQPQPQPQSQPSQQTQSSLRHSDAITTPAPSRTYSQSSLPAVLDAARNHHLFSQLKRTFQAWRRQAAVQHAQHSLQQRRNERQSRVANMIAHIVTSNAESAPTQQTRHKKQSSAPQSQAAGQKPVRRKSHHSRRRTAITDGEQLASDVQRQPKLAQTTNRRSKANRAPKPKPTAEVKSKPTAAETKQSKAIKSTKASRTASAQSRKKVQPRAADTQSDKNQTQDETVSQTIASAQPSESDGNHALRASIRRKLNQLALFHAARSAMVYHGWRPWMKFLELQKRNVRLADQHSITSKKYAVLMAWRRRTQEQQHNRMERRDLLLLRASQRVVATTSHIALMQWRKVVESDYIKSEQAKQLATRNAKVRAMHRWCDSTNQRQQLWQVHLSQLEHKIAPVSRVNVMKRFFRVWRHARDTSKMAAARQHTKEQVWNRVQSWLGEVGPTGVPPGAALLPSSSLSDMTTAVSIVSESFLMPDSHVSASGFDAVAEHSTFSERSDDYFDMDSFSQSNISHSNMSDRSPLQIDTNPSTFTSELPTVVSPLGFDSFDFDNNNYK